MPSISHKGRITPESPIRKLVPFSDAAKQRGVKVYHLNIGQPDIATPENAMAEIRNNTIKVVEYSHSAGNLSYRKKLVEYYNRLGVSLTTEDIIVTTGASEAFLFGMMTCLDSGDEVIIPEPFYANINVFAVSSDVNIVPVRSSIEDGFSLPPMEEFEKLITLKTKAILICNPNNPTGYLYSKQELEILIQIVKKYNLYLFVDEVYREFCYDGHNHTSILSFQEVDEHVIMIDSISKRYSACGARAGMLISRNKEVIRTAMKFAQARLSPPSFAQIIGEASIDVEPSYMSNVLHEYLSRRDIVVQSINKIPGAFCPNPKGAFYVVARLPIDDSDRFCKWLLEDFNYNNETVMMAPATGFYYTQGLGKNEVRISYVLNVDDLAKAMKCLEEALKVYPGKK